MTETPQARLGYRPDLDALRALAILGVLYTHFWNEAAPTGTLGVILFFGLSGFLITDILLSVRNRTEASGAPRLPALRNFFIRRALRLWPAYFLVLGLAVAFNFQNVRPVAGWHLFFLSNVLFSIRNDFVPWSMAAWWSLSLEEQFYLIWPALVCLPPRKWLGTLVTALMVLGAVWHFAMDRIGDAGLAAYFLPPAAFIPLGGGAALALLREKFGSIPRWVEWAGLAMLPLLGILLVTQWADWVLETLIALPLLALVAWGVREKRGNGPFLKLIRSRPVLWVGRVSYGIYLYHLFVKTGIAALGPWLPAIAQPGPGMFVAGSLLTIALASLSWVLLEAPCNRLKRRFPYAARPSSSHPSAPIGVSSHS